VNIDLNGIVIKGCAMNLTIKIPPELESDLKLRAAQAGIDVEAFVLIAIGDRLDADSSSTRMANCDSANQFAHWLDSWAKRFPVLEHQVDVSRESIYAGRGE
jgi:hypothetical protein